MYILVGLVYCHLRFSQTVATQSGDFTNVVNSELQSLITPHNNQNIKKYIVWMYKIKMYPETLLTNRLTVLNRQHVWTEGMRNAGVSL